jgi:hypothetical protein
MLTINKDKKSKPINIPKEYMKSMSFSKFESYYYKSPEEYNQKKKEDELYIERFAYMNNNFNPNFPKFNSPPHSESFKKKYLEKLANKILIN